MPDPDDSAGTGFDVPGAPDFVRELTAAQDLIEIVLARAEAAPAKPFTIIERSGAAPTVTTYAMLVARARRYAALYRTRDLPPGAMIVLMLVTHNDLAPAFLGAMMAGLVPTIFPPMTPKQDPALFWSAQRTILSRVEAALIATDKAQASLLATHLPGFATQVLDLDRGPGKESIAAAIPAPDGIAFLQFSSGTTGLKKGVILTHRAVLDFTAALATALETTGDDVIASWLPLYHDMGLIGCLMLPMALGLTVVQLNPFDWVTHPPTLLAAIERHRPTLCWMPNFAFHHILRATPLGARHDLSSLRALIDCSEPCKPHTLAAFAERFGRCSLRPEALQVSYGMAENVFIATQTKPGRPPRVVTADMRAYGEAGLIAEPERGEAVLDFVSVGPPIPGTRLRIMGNTGPLSDRRVGEIEVTSPYLFAGYFRQPRPATLRPDGWFSTGDLGFTLDGELFVCGRKDDLLIVNGRNLYAHDVEFAVNRATAVKPGRCVAIGPFNRRTGSQSLVVIAETTDGRPESRAALAHAIRTLVQAEFGVLAHNVLVTGPGWLVKTTSGKISREANTQKYLAVSPL